MNKIPVTIITGYLGAGKTTLLNYVLKNKEGYKVAVIVNDIGEVNIDAELIEKTGVVSQIDNNLVPLSNGCICCTLNEDLMSQVVELATSGKYDYILVEASGICEPVPIAQSICLIEDENDSSYPSCVRLDSIISVVDAKRMFDEFLNGEALLNDNLEDDDIENLLIQQIEFCNTIILNKVDEISLEDKNKVLKVIKALQKSAKIIETNYGKLDLSLVFNTYQFDFEKVGMSAGWIEAMLNDEDEHECHCHEDEHECHCHEHHHEHDEECHCHEHHEHTHECHHHHHHHHCHCHDGDVLEYGITTFVFKSRRPFDRLMFEDYVSQNFPKGIIRSKGMVWFSTERDIAYLFEQAGKQKTLSEAGMWYASAPIEKQNEYFSLNPEAKESWDSMYGDRENKIVIIGNNINKEEIIKKLNDCLSV